MKLECIGYSILHILNIVLLSYNCSKLRNLITGVKIMPKTPNFQILQTVGSTMQTNTYTLIAEGIKLNETANGDYSLIWTKV
jgi:hypothetical protein